MWRRVLRRELMVGSPALFQVMWLRGGFAVAQMPTWSRKVVQMSCGTMVFGSGGLVRSCCCPSSGWGPPQAKGGQARHVLGGGEEPEVGVDLPGAAYSGAASAVFAAHEVRQFPFDFGPVGSVVGLPGGIGLAFAGPGEDVFVGVDPDGAAAFGVGALAAQRAGAAGVAEVGDAAAVSLASDGCGDLYRAGDGVALEFALERALGDIPPAGGDTGWVLHPESMSWSSS